MSNPQAKTLSDGGNPASQAQYREMIARAKANSGSAPAPLAGMPRFDQIPKETPPMPGAAPERQQQLSPATAQGLSAMSKMQAAPKPAAPAKEEATGAEAEAFSTTEAPEEDEDLKVRKAVEARLQPIDVGQFILAGEATQLVPIIPEHLTVVFRTVTDDEETFVDLQLSKEKDMTSGRQFLRRQSEWALALHIKSVNGTEWPKVLASDGSVDKEVAAERIKRVRKLAGPVFSLMGQNMAWFLERVNSVLTVAALKNG
jgi:hypothetical protein